MNNNRKLCVAVCICTFKRPAQLSRLLSGLDEQVFASALAVTITIIVVDNSPQEEGAQVCRDYDGPWQMTYKVEARAGISHARTTSLSAVPSDCNVVAMIDDDERPEPTWLANLLDARERSGADIVVGRTTPVFPPATPTWVSDTGFFLKPQNQEQLADLDSNPPAATCNVMFDAALLHAPGVYFAPEFGLSGGEDKMLFQSLKQQGKRFVWAPEARVSEFIPAERAQLSYMLREAYRRGWVINSIKLRLKSRSTLHSVKIVVKLLLRAVFGIAKNLLLVLLNLVRGRSVWVPFGLNIASNLGTVAGVLRIPNRHYRRAGA